MPPPPPYGKDITHATLATSVGNKQLIRHLYADWGDPDFWIPDPDCLKPGDVILTRPSPTRAGRIDKWLAKKIVELQQEHCEGDHCEWTHASLYIGDLMVAEANKSWPPRTKVTPITKWANHDFKILRWSGASAFDVNEAIRAVLLDQLINPRGYDTSRALLASVGIWTAPDHKRRVICSEYVLGCLAAGQIMVGEKARIEEQENTPKEERKYYFPAHMAADPNFDHLQMRYSKIIKIPRTFLRKR